MHSEKNGEGNSNDVLNFDEIDGVVDRIFRHLAKEGNHSRIFDEIMARFPGQDPKS